MRIITGQYKGRRFEVPRTFKARPTTDFAKENIFNVLTAYVDFEGATALDLFSGTGSIALELVIRQCADKLGLESSSLQCIRGDVFRFLKSCRQQFDLIFADPPYALKELPTIPDLVMEKNIMTPGGVFVFEHGKDHEFSSHPCFVEHRSYGSVNFSLFRHPT